MMQNALFKQVAHLQLHLFF